MAGDGQLTINTLAMLPKVGMIMLGLPVGTVNLCY